MAAKLVAEEGALKGLVLSLEDGDHWVIGRDPDACQLLVEDPSASRKHLVCRTTPQGILVENLSTTNPTQVNDEEVKEPRLLQNGDLVRIGDGMFRFYAEAAAHLFKETSQNGPAVSIATEHPIVEGNGKKQPPEGSTSQEDNQEAEEKRDEKKESKEFAQSEKGEPSEPAKEPLKDKPIENKPEDKSPEEKTAATAAAGEEKSKEAKATAQEKGSLESEKVVQESKGTKESKESDMKSSPVEKEPEEVMVETAAPAAKTAYATDERHDTIFDEEPSDKHALAEINFGLLDTGRWLLKVIGGPNNGAEFSMQTGSSYIIGTDPNVCDIVFHDTSVSRQHARITVGQDDTLNIEDLKSRNGTNVDGEVLKEKRILPPNTIVSMGTTSFVVFDREGEMQTIISPLMPSIVKTLKEEAKKPEDADAAVPAVAPEAAPKAPEIHPTTTLGAFILIGILTGLFVIVGIGTSTLFRSEPVVVAQNVDVNEALDNALAPFPSVKYTFNKNTGQLLLVGHVLTATDRSQLLYSLQGLRFIKSLDESGIVIDEYVWREINQIIEKNPEWKGINIMAPSPGHFVVSGYLQKRSQANSLSEYLSANFPYPDLLDQRIIVDEEIVSSVNNLLLSKGFKNVVVQLLNGEVILTGTIPLGQGSQLEAVVPGIKEIRGVRSVRNQTAEQAPELSLVNITDKYDVTGISSQGGRLSVVINGRILMKGDILDGMTITTIQRNAIFLEKDGVKYRIDFSR